MLTMKVMLGLYFSIVLTSCIKIKSVNSINILGVFPIQCHSHFFVFETYLKELATRGHNVTVISYFPQNETIINYHDIILSEELITLEDEFSTDQSYWSILKTILFLGEMGDNCKLLLDNEKVQQLWKTNTKFDVFVTDQFISDCPLGLAYALKAPVVALTSHALMPWHYSRFGVPSNPSYVSHMFLYGGTKPTFIQKLQRMVFSTLSNLFYTYLNQRIDQNTLAKHFNNIPPLEELARDIKFLLHYTNFIHSGTKVMPQNIIEVGGYHVAKPKILPDDLRKFVEEAHHGVIYISFGTVIKTSSMPNDIFEAILGAIKILPQRFIWKYHNNTLFMDDNKLHVSNWLPQVDILGHPNVVAFVSHGGMAGTTEALYFGVPVVAVPILGDQPSNAASIEESGMGVQLQLWDLTTDSLVAALKKVMEPKFRANTKLVSRAWRDRLMSPMDTAIYWTEYAARYSNFTFRTVAADVPWYQYMYLDIIFVCIAALYLLATGVQVPLRLYGFERNKEVIDNKKLKCL